MATQQEVVGAVAESDSLVAEQGVAEITELPIEVLQSRR